MSRVAPATKVCQQTLLARLGRVGVHQVRPEAGRLQPKLQVLELDEGNVDDRDGSAVEQGVDVLNARALNRQKGG